MQDNLKFYYENKVFRVRKHKKTKKKQTKKQTKKKKQKKKRKKVIEGTVGILMILAKQMLP